MAGQVSAGVGGAASGRREGPRPDGWWSRWRWGAATAAAAVASDASASEWWDEGVLGRPPSRREGLVGALPAIKSPQRPRRERGAAPTGALHCYVVAPSRGARLRSRESNAALVGGTNAAVTAGIAGLSAGRQWPGASAPSDERNWDEAERRRWRELFREMLSLFEASDRIDACVLDGRLSILPVRPSSWRAPPSTWPRPRLAAPSGTMTSGDAFRERADEVSRIMLGRWQRKRGLGGGGGLWGLLGFGPWVTDGALPGSMGERMASTDAPDTRQDVDAVDVTAEDMKPAAAMGAPELPAWPLQRWLERLWDLIWEQVGPPPGESPTPFILEAVKRAATESWYNELERLQPFVPSTECGAAGESPQRQRLRSADSAAASVGLDNGGNAERESRAGVARSNAARTWRSSGNASLSSSRSTFIGAGLAPGGAVPTATATTTASAVRMDAQNECCGESMRRHDARHGRTAIGDPDATDNGVDFGYHDDHTHHTHAVRENDVAVETGRHGELSDDSASGADVSLAEANADAAALSAPDVTLHSPERDIAMAPPAEDAAAVSPLSDRVHPAETALTAWPLHGTVDVSVVVYEMNVQQGMYYEFVGVQTEAGIAVVLFEDMTNACNFAAELIGPEYPNMTFEPIDVSAALEMGYFERRHLLLIRGQDTLPSQLRRVPGTFGDAPERPTKHIGMWNVSAYEHLLEITPEDEELYLRYAVAEREHELRERGFQAEPLALGDGTNCIQGTMPLEACREGSARRERGFLYRVVPRPANGPISVSESPAAEAATTTDTESTNGYLGDMH
ncbi:hypothetical protein CDCA_CDCA03G0979 [Cyanidium caldarium]|uniref:Uncharacterized protein n=1 Tax=Cyanidium caldarium TaxID=2771 RepID=A0AAV9IRS1_CYACA|nr:hypothetical protein CDCA_CDCA03G0979 [Cyanidium caldarium]